MVFHLPLGSDSGFDKPIERRLRVGRPWQSRIDIGLLNMFEWRGGITKHRSPPIVIPLMKRLSSTHPVRHILTVFAE